MFKEQSTSTDTIRNYNQVLLRGKYTSSIYLNETPCVFGGFPDHSTSCHTVDMVPFLTVIHHVRLSCASLNCLQNKFGSI